MPCLASIAAWAMLPLMSCQYIRLSTEMDELKSSAALSSAPCARPAQSFSNSVSPCISSKEAGDSPRPLVKAKL